MKDISHFTFIQKILYLKANPIYKNEYLNTLDIHIKLHLKKYLEYIAKFNNINDIKYEIYTECLGCSLKLQYPKKNFNLLCNCHDYDICNSCRHQLDTYNICDFDN